MQYSEANKNETKFYLGKACHQFKNEKCYDQTVESPFKIDYNSHLLTLTFFTVFPLISQVLFRSLFAGFNRTANWILGKFGKEPYFKYSDQTIQGKMLLEFSQPQRQMEFLIKEAKEFRKEILHYI